MSVSIEGPCNIACAGSRSAQQDSTELRGMRSLSQFTVKLSKSLKMY
jgi:hypothetical protein